MTENPESIGTPRDAKDNFESRYSEFGMRMINSVTSVPVLIPLNSEISAFAVKVRLVEETAGAEIVAIDETIPLEILAPSIFGILSLIQSGTNSVAFNASKFDTLYMTKASVMQYLEEISVIARNLKQFVDEKFIDESTESELKSR